MLRKFQAKYSSDIKTLKTPKCIRHRTVKEHNEVGNVSSMILSKVIYNIIKGSFNSVPNQLLAKVHEISTPLDV